MSELRPASAWRPPSQSRLLRAAALLRQHGYTIISPEKSNSSDVIVIGNLRLDRQIGALYCDRKLIPLTSFQFVALWTLMESRGAWCSADHVLHALWQTQKPNRRSLAVHLHRIRRKLQECTGCNLIVSSRKKGYRFATEAVIGISA